MTQEILGNKLDNRNLQKKALKISSILTDHGENNGGKSAKCSFKMVFL